MYKTNEIKIGMFAQMVGITVHTLQRLDRLGIVPSRRTDTDRRYYLQSDYDKYIQLINERKNYIRRKS